jgi:RNA polymerase sigma factor (sigma-70 family)
MRDSIKGDTTAYKRFLEAATPHLRAMVRHRYDQIGWPSRDAEDVVQKILLAVHLKRGTWDPERRIGPWLSAIVRNKLIDSLRPLDRRVNVPVEDVMETIDVEQPNDGFDRVDAGQLLQRLKDPQREIVRSISLQGRSIDETAEGLKMTEAAVRVALHRALKCLAAFCRSDIREHQ